MSNVAEARERRQEDRWWAHIDALTKLDPRDPLVRGGLAKLAEEKDSTEAQRSLIQLIDARYRREETVARQLQAAQFVVAQARLQQAEAEQARLASLPPGAERDAAEGKVKTLTAEARTAVETISENFAVLGDWSEGEP